MEKECSMPVAHDFAHCCKRFQDLQTYFHTETKDLRRYYRSVDMINEAEVLELISRDDDTEDNGILVKSETGDSAEKSKTDKIKSEPEEKSGNLTVTVSKNKKGRSVADSDAQGESEEKKHYRCNVCNINCYKEISFASHLKGQKHMKMMESVMKVTEARSHQIAARLQAESHLRKIEGHSGTTKSSKSPLEKKPAAGSGKVLESHCKTCDKKFTGAYRDHKDKDEHKERDSLRRDGCKICSISTFSNYNNYATHLESKMHMKKSYPHCHICKQWFKSPRKFVQHCKTDHHLENKSQRGRHKDDTTVTDVDEMSELVTLDVVGFEDETGADKEEDMDVTEGNKKSTTMNLEALTPMLSRAKATSTPKPRQLSSEEETIVVPEKYDPEAAVGQSYIVPVSGYFCKLCHKFYNNEAAAKTVHCQSEMHYERYKKIMVSKASSAKSKEENSIKQDITADDQSVNSTKDNNQSLSSTKNNSQSLATEASNYQTADEQQDSTIQKTTDSSQDTAKQLPNGSSTVDSSKEIDSQNDKDTNMEAQDDDKKDSDQDDVLIVGESKGMGRGTTNTRGSRNKARRGKRV